MAKRARSDFRGVFLQAYSYGQCGPLLHKRFRKAGAKKDLQGALKAWVWLVVSVFRIAQPTRRIEWARGAGTRLGRLEASWRLRVFFPDPAAAPTARSGALPAGSIVEGVRAEQPVAIDDAFDTPRRSSSVHSTPSRVRLALGQTMSGAGLQIVGAGVRRP